jgi:hypothetical protein
MAGAQRLIHHAAQHPRPAAAAGPCWLPCLQRLQVPCEEPAVSKRSMVSRGG